MSVVNVAEEKRIVTLSINRPEKLNALNIEVLDFLEALLPGLDADGVIFTGEGGKAFAAGADIKEMLPYSAIEMLAFCRKGRRIAELLERGPYVTVAAINGFALGGGLELALACDFILAAEGSKFGLPEAKLGIIPGFGGGQRLADAIGARRARELMMSGAMFDANEALQWGLVNRIVSKNELMQEANKTLHKICANSKTAVLSVKKALWRNLEGGLSLEESLCAVCFSTDERRAAMEEFAAK